MSSSIDNLINTFFASSNTQPATTSTIANDTEFNLDDLIESELKTTSTTRVKSHTDNFLTRTKSISICVDNMNNDNEANASSAALTSAMNSTNAFSLNDLANEYLATMTPTLTNNTASLAGSQIEMIDHEFSQRFNLDEKHGHEDSDAENKELIEFSIGNLLINHKTSANKSLLSRKHLSNTEISSSVYSSTSSLGNSKEALSSSKKPLQQLKLIATTKKDELNVDTCLKNIFSIRKESTFALFLTNLTNQMSPNGTCDVETQICQQKFNYSSQSSEIKRKFSMNFAQRKKIIIDYDSEQLAKKEKAKAVAAATVKSLNSSSTNSTKKARTQQVSNETNTLSTAALAASTVDTEETSVVKLKTPKKNKKSADSGLVAKPIKMFDFSIPSPDDCLIAKQKFAFKNMRFK